MPLTLEEYAAGYLPGRGLAWPAAPEPVRPRARPHLVRLPVKAVLWTVYGTLLSTPGGELRTEPADDEYLIKALEKLIQEFKMWQSMSRKPGAPGAQMRDLYRRALTPLRLAGSGKEKYPEVAVERAWDEVVRKLFAKEFRLDAELYGSADEFAKKVAYFFHASLQGTGPYPGAAAAVRAVAAAGNLQGLLADGQCFTFAQVYKALRDDAPGFDAAEYFPADLRVVSGERRARKPSPALFDAAVAAAAARGLRPGEVLHVGSSLTRDLGPAKKAGMRTALFAGDKASLAATREQLKDPALRPDVLLTALPQIADVVG